MIFLRTQNKPSSLTKPATFSLAQFRSDIRQTLLLGSVVTGKGIPNATVRIFLTPEGIQQEVKTDGRGLWSFTIPQTLKNRHHTFTIEVFDRNSQLIAGKTYKVSLIPPPKAAPPYLKWPFNLDKVAAQEESAQSSYGPAWGLWVRQMEFFGFRPTIEDGEIIVYQEDLYCERYQCPAFRIHANPNVLNIGKRLREQYKYFLQHLVARLNTDCYRPITALSEYFPEIADEGVQRELGVSDFVPESSCPEGIKETISEETLRNTIAFLNQNDIVPPSLSDREREVDIYLQTKHKGFIKAVAKELTFQGYAPSLVLAQHFPEFNKEEVRREFGISMVYSFLDKTSMSADDFKSLLIVVYKKQENAFLRSQTFRSGTSLGALIDLTDPLFATRAIVNMLTLPEEELSDGDLVDAALGMTFLAGPVLKATQVGVKGTFSGVQLTYKSIIHHKKLADEIKDLRKAFRQELLPLEVAEGKASASVYEAALATGKRSPIFSNLRPRNLEAATRFHALYNSKLLPLWAVGKAYVLDPGVSRPILIDLMDKIESWAGGVFVQRGRVRLDRAEILEVIDKNWIIVVKDEEFQRAWGNLAPFTQDRLIIIPEGAFFHGQYIYHTLYHELTHVIQNTMHPTPQTFSRKVQFIYNQHQADVYGAVMSQLFELSTDLLVETLTGLPGGYKTAYPRMYNSMYELVQTTIRKSKGSLALVDFMEYGLTQQDGELMRKILKTMTPAQFMQIVDQRINVAKLLEVQRLNASFYERNRQGLLVAGGTIGLVDEFIFIHEALSRVARGEMLPPETEVLSLPPALEDTDLLREILPAPNEVVIGEVQMPFYQGSTAEISSIVTEDGAVVDAEGYVVNWYLDHLNDAQKEGISEEPYTLSGLPILTSCPGNRLCTMSIPGNLSPGTYRLSALLTKVNDQGVLAGDSIRVRVEQKKIVKIVMNNQDFNFGNTAEPYKLYLEGNGRPQTFEIPITITLSDDKTEYAVLRLRYRPPVPTEAPPPTTPPVDEQQPSVTQVPEEINMIVTQPPIEQTPQVPSCPLPYPQCGGTAGLEDYATTDTILVTPVCDEEGNIFDYQKENLGDRGECL